MAKPCVLLTSPNEDLSLEVLTSQAALQVYTGNYLAGTPAREGGTYQDFSGIALETQCLPDTPNHPEWKNYGGVQKQVNAITSGQSLGLNRVISESAVKNYCVLTALCLYVIT